MTDKMEDKTASMYHSFFDQLLGTEDRNRTKREQKKVMYLREEHNNELPTRQEVETRQDKDNKMKQERKIKQLGDKTLQKKNHRNQQRQENCIQ